MPIEKIIVEDDALLEDDALVRKSLEQQLRNRRYDVAGAAPSPPRRNTSTKTTST
jgi:hypothetical protein